MNTSSKGIWWCALAFAMLFPTAVTTTNMIVLSGQGEGNSAQQIAYIGGTILQFSFPVVFLLLAERRLPSVALPKSKGLAIGLAFGLIVAAGMITLYYALISWTSLFDRTAQQVPQKMGEFGIDSARKYWLFAVFLSVIHSLLEEYYWRWFVFGGLCRLISEGPAIVLSAVAFALHHVVLLWVWLPDQILTGVVPFSICVALGGGVWAWLYRKSGSIYAPWLSHFIVDAAIFVVGFDLFLKG